jgi:RNA polymerase sigma-70 factor (ECF subfamily)
MDDLRALGPDGLAICTRDTVSQDAVYTRAAAEFGPPLARLAAAYESDPSRQQDLLQDLHFALWRSVAAFRNQCSLRTWAYRMAHNTATSYVRQQRRSRRVRLASLEEPDDLADETDVERSANDVVVLGKGMELIQRLKPLDRDVLLLHLGGLQAAEIGEVAGISSTNVAQKIHRARKYLKRHFQRGGKHDEDR